MKKTKGQSILGMHQIITVNANVGTVIELGEEVQVNTYYQPSGHHMNTSDVQYCI